MRITFLSYTLLIALASCAQSTEGRAILHYALTFLERPYVAYTLEAGNKEQLIMNLNEVDCTTYVEYALALTLAKGDTLCAQNYLKRIRYRDGMIDDYVSRLRHTSGRTLLYVLAPQCLPPLKGLSYPRSTDG